MRTRHASIDITQQRRGTVKLIRVFALLVAMTAMIVVAPVATASPARQNHAVFQSETLHASAPDQDQQQESMPTKNKIVGAIALAIVVGYGIRAARRSYGSPLSYTRR